MAAHYTDFNYGTDDPVVTSLTEANGSGLSVYNVRTHQKAVRGDLEIDLALETKRASDVWEGSRALKYVGEGYKDAVSKEEIGNPEDIIRNGFFFGPVVEGIVVNSANTTVESANHLYLQDGTASGRVILNLSDSWDRLPLPVQAVHLDQMRDQFIGGMVAIAFYKGQKSGFSGSVYVPWFMGDQAGIKIRLTLVCGAAGEVIDSDMFTGRVLVIPAAHCNPQMDNLPASGLGILKTNIPRDGKPYGDEEELIFDFHVQDYPAFTYFTVESEPVAATPGSMVWFSFHCNGEYDKPLSIIKMEARMAAIENIDESTNVGDGCDCPPVESLTFNDVNHALENNDFPEI